MMDDDVEVYPGDLGALWESRRKDVCMVPEVRGRAGELQNAIIRTTKLFEPRWKYGHVPVPEVDYPLGACFLVSRELFDRAGGFDERFHPNYFEDTAFGAAIRKAGGRTLMVPRAVAHHLAPSSSDGERPRRQRAAIQRNRWRYVLHYGAGPGRVVALALAPLRVVRESATLRSWAPILALADFMLGELREVVTRGVRRGRSRVEHCAPSASLTCRPHDN